MVVTLAVTWQRNWNVPIDNFDNGTFLPTVGIRAFLLRNTARVGARPSRNEEHSKNVRYVSQIAFRCCHTYTVDR